MTEAFLNTPEVKGEYKSLQNMTDGTADALYNMLYDRVVESLLELCSTAFYGSRVFTLRPELDEGTEMLEKLKINAIKMECIVSL